MSRQNPSAGGSSWYPDPGSDQPRAVEPLKPLKPGPGLEGVSQVVVLGLGRGGKVIAIDRSTEDRVPLPPRLVEALERDVQERVLKRPKAPRS